MLLWFPLLIALGANATILHRPRAAQPGSPVFRRAPAQSISMWSNTSSSAPASISVAPDGSVALRLTDCKPSSICFDGRSCGVRYGGCYDANFCDGNTSPYPVPTCSVDPGVDLTAQRMADKADVVDGNNAADAVARAIET